MSSKRTIRDSSCDKRLHLSMFLARDRAGDEEKREKRERRDEQREERVSI
jgi:hypothetical protein